MTLISEAAPIIITGMHRSGTSFVASLLRNSGLDIGARLMPPARDNPRGFFENLDVVGFHERWLRLNGYDAAGWLAPQSFSLPEEAVSEAIEIVASNQSAAPWGWKDPRSTLFLDFWASITPNARYVFLYREPSEVIDSLFRRGDGPVMAAPELAARSWLAHNGSILQFVRAHRRCCMLANIKVVARDPQRFLQMVSTRFAADIDVQASSPFEPRLMTSLEDVTAVPTLLRYLMPELERLYIDLETEADLAASVHRDGAITPKRARDAFFRGWLASRGGSTGAAQAVSAAGDTTANEIEMATEFYESLTKLRGAFEQYQTALSDFSKKLDGEDPNAA